MNTCNQTIDGVCKCRVVLTVVMVWAAFSGNPVLAAESISGEPSHSKSYNVEIHPGEFLHTAHTLPAGQFVFHPLFYPSTLGLSERVDITFPILGLLDGPSLSVGVNAWESERWLALVEPHVQSFSSWDKQDERSGWNFDLVQAGARVRLSRTLNKHRLNAGTGMSYRSSSSLPVVPLELGVDLLVSSRAMVQFSTATNASGLVNGRSNGTVLASVHYGWSRYRLSVGALGHHGDPEGVGSQLGSARFEAVEGVEWQPYLAMWWRFGADSDSSRRQKAAYGWRNLGGDAAGESGYSHLTLPRYSVGVSLGAGIRDLDPTEVPDGISPRLDLFVMEVRRSLVGSYRYGLAPARIDVQLDGVHTYFTSVGTTWPRVPVCGYATWLRPASARSSLALSAGLYTELGWDRFVESEQLIRRPAGTLGPAGRVGWERHGRLLDAGMYLRGIAGFSLGSDPNHPALTRYIRLGLEHTWVWGRRSVGANQ